MNVETQRETLTIVKPSFDPKRKWDLVMKGFNISALCIDTDFNAKVKARNDGFFAGDELIADVHTKKTWDASCGAYVNREFILAKIYSHTPPKTVRQLTTEDIVSTNNGKHKKKKRK